MKGSEKQIAWAEKIIASARATLESGIAQAQQYCPEELDLWVGLKKAYEDYINTVTSAAEIIDRRKGLDGDAILHKIAQLRTLRSNGVEVKP